MSGRFIVVEGPEGAGKSTLISALERRLRDAGDAVRVVKEPGGTPFGTALRALVLDPAHRIPAESELFVMLAARAALVASVIRPGLAAGEIVLSDRFDLSTMAYQVAGRGLPRGAVEAANRVATGGLVPDLTLVLDLPAGVGAARQRAAGKTPDRLEREDPEFHGRVREAYLTATGPGVTHLDATVAPPALADRAWQALRALIER